MGSIVDKAIKELSEQLAEREVTIELTDAARAFFARIGYDRDNGARPLARIVQDRIKRPLGDELLFGKLIEGGHVTVDVEPADEPSGDAVLDAKADEEREVEFRFSTASPNAAN